MKNILKISLIWGFLFSLSPFNIYCQYTKEKTPKIYLLTCEPGTNLYTMYGHSALRILDKEKNTDWVYNFGKYNSKEKYFFIKFIFGRQAFHLDKEPFKNFISKYKKLNITISQQELKIEHENILSIRDHLDSLILNNKNSYNYDYLKDNCTTRLRDIIFNNLKDKQNICNLEDKPIRVSLENKFINYKWLQVTLHMFSGKQIEYLTSCQAQSFLPNTLYEVLKNNKQAVIKEDKLFHSKSKIITTSFPYPKHIFSVFFFLYTLISFLKVKAKFKLLITKSIFISAGIIGLVIIILNLFSLQSGFKENYNFLWLNPLLISLSFKQIKYNIAERIVIIIIICTLIFYTFIIASRYYFSINQYLVSLTILLSMYVYLKYKP